MKTNEGLADFALYSYEQKRPYIYGTFGKKLTTAILNRVYRDYPKYVTEKRYKYAKEHYLGKRTDDCYGMIKNYLMLPGDDFDSDPIYSAKLDINADTAFELASEKGTIDTMPDIRGICVRYKGHAGVYVGDGEVVEMRGFDYGAFKAPVKARKWTHWYKSSFVEYNAEKPQNNVNKSITEIAKEVIAGKWDNYPKRKELLEAAGYNYEEVQAEVNKLLKPSVIMLTVTGVNHALNMRNAPGMSGAIINTIPLGKQVELLQKTTDKWYKVKYNGKIGYCWSGYLK